jgi:RNA polymerase sigma factor (TIGR02999 family)
LTRSINKLKGALFVTQEIVESKNVTNITLLLNKWGNGDIDSGNILKEQIYFHIKNITKDQISKKDVANEKNNVFEQLPNPTSLLHNVLMELPYPDAVIENRQQYYKSLALFIRRMLLDELKIQNAQKRGGGSEQVSITEILFHGEDNQAYLFFDEALSKLEVLSKRCFEITLQHYFLGLSIAKLMQNFSVSEKTIYRDLDAGKAFLRTQIQII